MDGMQSDYSSEGYEVIGMDISESKLDKARQNAD